ncbi:MAG: gliding motility-associated C-terminal domain-containing protein [Chryseolinea sp.]
MKNLFAGVLLVLSISVAGQQYKTHYDLALPDSIAFVKPVWADMDNDGLLDVLLLSTSKTGDNYLQWIKGDTVNSPVLKSQAVTVITTVNAFHVTDYDHDNLLDIVLSGLMNSVAVTVVYINDGSFTFTKKTLLAPSFEVLKVTDLDNDARQEWIISGIENGNYFFRILKQNGPWSWMTVHDSIAMRAFSVNILDANNDGFTDLFVSGTLKPDSVVSAVLINDGKLSFRPISSIDVGGLSSAGDTNADGLIDVMMMGTDKQNLPQAFLFESNGGDYDRLDQDFDLKNGVPFVADLNSDGTTDKNFTGVTLSADTLNVNVFSLQSSDTIDSENLVTQCFGDMDFDGDLDLLKVKKHTSLHLLFLENTITDKNSRPGSPTHATATVVFGRTFLYWNKATDDHTPTASITYDLHIEGANTSLTANFDIVNEKRLLVANGNNGTENFALIRNVTPSTLRFAVQAIDNSFHPSGICIGGSCSQPSSVHDLTACSNETIKLSAPTDSYWFSFAKGYLGWYKDLSMGINRNDTIFYYSPVGNKCGDLVVWTIGIRNDTLKTEFKDKYACTGTPLTLSVESGWSTVTWKSRIKGNLGSGQTIQYAVEQPDSVFATLSNGKGCTIVRKTAIKISKPDVLVAVEDLKIAKGSSVTLNATGAQRYEWTPISGLDHGDVASPVASPPATIQYIVTGYDSLGCADKAIVNVQVEEGGFLPNLFTPNEDGRNDELKVYGLVTVKDFNFSVYNREGSLVFKTNSVSEATQRGWDGTKNGTMQPPGVYYWKVGGEGSSGSKILLNGKEAGSIVLVR